MIVSASVDALARLAEAEVRRHERRAAAAVWAACVTSRTPEEARRALATFGTPETQSDAAQLLGRLAQDVPAGNPARRAALTERRQS